MTRASNTSRSWHPATIFAIVHLLALSLMGLTASIVGDAYGTPGSEYSTHMRLIPLAEPATEDQSSALIGEADHATEALV